jgi:hypothetical protein
MYVFIFLIKPSKFIPPLFIPLGLKHDLGAAAAVKVMHTATKCFGISILIVSKIPLV